MKTYLKLVLVSLIILVSCTKDVLDVTSSKDISLDTFWKTESDVRLALNGVYSRLAELEVGYIFFDALSDNAFNFSPWLGFKPIADGTHSSRNPNAIKLFWAGYFGGIGRANAVLDNYNSVSGLKEDFKNSVKGEALFLRAYFYSKLTDLYGCVPIILESPNLEQQRLPRNTKEEVVNQIILDLDAAASLLPTTQSEVGRATKGAALALKARVLLYNSRWPEAATTAKEVMGMGYSLFPNYRNLFREANENNVEVIFDVQYKTPEQGNHFEVYLGSFNTSNSSNFGWLEIAPTQNIVDAYQMSNGKPITDSTSGYDETNPYENRDPRLKQSISVAGATYNGVKNFVSKYGGHSFIKFTEFGTDVITTTAYPNTTGQNPILLRLAEILLTYAEAKNEESGPDASVYKAIDDIRKRVNMPPLPTGLTKDQMREAIRYERRVELVLEGQRYSDIRRWRIAESVLNNFVDYNLVKRKFDPNRDYLWPIPGSEFDIEGTQLTQNPGYGGPVGTCD